VADETLVLNCRVADFNVSTGVCAAPFYSAPLSALPTLTIADANAIGLAVAMLWGLAFSFRMFKKAINEIG
jgi:hypothetical protein